NSESNDYRELMENYREERERINEDMRKAREQLRSQNSEERERILNELKAQQDKNREQTREAMELQRELMRKNREQMKQLFDAENFKFSTDGNAFLFSTEHSGIKGKTQSALEKQLLADGLIETAAAYRFELSGKGWVKVNGRKQPQATYEKYKKLWEETTGETVDEDTHFQINKKTQAR
ncbi:MAG: hypothetical protein KDD28_27910, partial [Phaeodactylibacter sp.]|nr:hypothetical protein [Phaeodactylibacter sp.]